MTLAVITLVLSLVALVFAALVLRNGTGPVMKLTVAPVHGAQLTVVMVFGFVQLVVLAMYVAILHQVKVAEEALR